MTEADETTGNNETPAISEPVEKDETDPVVEPVEDEVVEPTTTPELPAESKEPTDAETLEESGPTARIAGQTVTVKATLDGTDYEEELSGIVTYTLEGLLNDATQDSVDVVLKDIAPAANTEYALAGTDPVTITVDGTALSAGSDLTVTEGTYTIANTAITGAVVITINLVTKEYTVNAPEEDENNVTFTIKDASDTNEPTGTSVKVKKAEGGTKVVVRATYNGTEGAVTVAMAGADPASAKLDATNKTADFEIDVTEKLTDTATPVQLTATCTPVVEHTSHLVLVGIMDDENPNETIEAADGLFAFASGIAEELNEDDGETYRYVVSKEDISFTIDNTKLPAGMQLAESEPVTATVDGVAKDVTLGGDKQTYTIDNTTAAITSDIMITLHVCQKTYTVEAPTAYNTDVVTWQVKGSAADAQYGATVDAKAGDTVTFRATLKDGANAVKVTVEEATENKEQVLNSTKKTAEFAVPVSALLSGETVNTLTLDYKEMATVTIKGDPDTVKVGTDFTVQYSVKKGEGGKYIDYTSLTGSTIPDVYVGESIALKIKATPKDNKQRTVKTVTWGADTSVSGDPDEADGVDVYVVTPVAGGADANTVTVALDDTQMITIKQAADAQIASVTYSSTSGSIADKPAVKDGEEWKVYSTASDVTLKVTAKTHNKVSYIHKGTEAHTEDCEHDMTITPGGVVTSEAIDVSAADQTVTIGTEKITVEYTLDAPDDETVTVAILDSSKTAVNAKVVENAPAGTKPVYVLNDGENYFVKVTGADLQKLSTVEVNGTKLKYIDYEAAFALPATVDDIKGDTNPTITVALKEAQGYDVAIAMDTIFDTDALRATVQADKFEYKKEDGTKAEQEAEAAAKDVTATVTYAKVWEGTNLSFTLKAKDEANYKIDKVFVKKTADADTPANWTELQGVSGKYTISAISANMSVKVTTALDETKAYSVTFVDESGNVKNVAVTADGKTSTLTDFSKPVYLKKAADASVSFTVAPQTGYEVTKVASGTTDDDVMTGPTYTYNKFSESATSATITISTKATTLSADKFVEFSLGNDVWLNITEPADIQPEKDTDGKDTNIYKLTKEVKDGETVTTPEISELKFDLIVPDGFALNKSFVDGQKIRATSVKRVKADDGSSWVYSYKVVANQVTGTTADTADSITVPDAIRETVTLRLADGSKTLQYKNINSYPYDFEDLEYPTQVEPGSTIVLKVNDNQTLKVDGEDVKLDSANKYSFLTELTLDENNENDSTVEIDVQDATEYAIAYEINPEAPDKVTYPGTAGNNAIDVNYDSKVYVRLQNKADETPVEISRAVITTEGAKSTVVKDADQAKNRGKAIITVKDEAVSAAFYTKVTDTVNGFVVDKEILAGTISFESKDATGGKTLTAKGISNKGTLKLDATSATSYALTLKQGRTTLNVVDYIKKDALTAVVADPTVAEAGFSDEGYLWIWTLKGDKATTDITISAKGEESALLTFKVEGQTPKLAVKSVASTNQGMHDILLDVTGDSKIKTIANKFKLYYEVKVAQTEGSSTAKKDGTYYLNATNYSGNVIPVSQLFHVNDEKDKEKFENSYTFTVRLVAVDKDTKVTAGDPLNGTSGTALADRDVLFATATATEKIFKTRPAKYEAKLGVTKKTTKFFSGQYNVTVAIPKFSKDAGYIDNLDAEVYLKDGSLAENVWISDIDPDTMAVKVNAGALAAGSYDVVIYAEASYRNGKDTEDGFDMYQASAKVPITVQKGINDIEVVYPKQIAILADKKGNKKDASITLKTTGWYGTEYKNGKRIDVKAQSQKFIYELDTESLGNPKNAANIVVKNNKITVKKDFIVGNDPADNTFTVKVYANDYADHGYYEEAEITVSDKALSISSVRLISSDDDKVLSQNPTPAEIDNAYVEILDGNGQRVNPELVTLTPNKGKIHVDSDGDVVVDGYQKTLTVKAVANDGGKSTKSSARYTIDYPKGVSYTITPNVNGVASNALQRTGDRSWNYKGTGNNAISFTVKAALGEDTPVTAYTSKYNYTVKVTGGKDSASKESIASGWHYITPNSAEVKITITDKTKKAPNTVEFIIKDTNWQTAAAPKASTRDKLYVAWNGEDGYNIRQTLNFTVSKNNGYNAVKLTPVSGNFVSSDWSWDDDYGYRPVVFSGVRDIENDRFAIEDIFASGAGSSKYSVVYGNKVDGVFYPKTKAATITIKSTKVGNIKATTKYTINPNVSMNVKLEAKPASVDGLVWFQEVLSANVKGERNKFYDYFEVIEDTTLDEMDQPVGTGVYRLWIKEAKRTTAGLEELAALTKDDLTGYLKYQYVNANGNTVVKQDKITVVISDKSIPKYAATPINVVSASGTKAETTVTLGNTPVSIAKAATTTAGWSVELNAESAKTGVVTLKADNPTSGNLDLFIIPTDSQYVKNNASAKPEEVGVKVQVKVTAKAADDTKTKLTFAKGTKTPVASINNSNKVDLTVTLEAGKDFDYTLSNATISAVDKTDAATITKADDKAAAEAVTSKPVFVKAGTVVEGETVENDTITIVLDRDKLVGNKQYRVPVDLTFTAGAKETAYFSVKTETIPTMSDIKTLVANELKDFAVTAYNNGTAAAAEVKAAADAIEIPALSGIRVDKVEPVADTADSKFADEGEGDAKKPGHHTVKVTLKDVTKTADAEAADKTGEVDIVVTEKTETKTLGQTLYELIGKYAIPAADGTVAEGKVAVTADMTAYTVQSALQTAADTVEPGKYIVKVTNFKVSTTEVPDAAARAIKVTNMTFTYRLYDAMTGRQNASIGGGVNVANGVNPQPIVPVTKVTITGPATVAKKADNTAAEAEYSAVVTGDSNNAVTWKLQTPVTGVSINATTGVLTVESTAADDAKVIIMATSVKDSSVSGIYEVTITAAPVTVESVIVSVKDGGNAEISVNGTLTLSAEVRYSANRNDEEAEIVWTLTDSADKEVVDTVASIAATDGNTAEATLTAKSELGSVTGFKVTATATLGDSTKTSVPVVVTVQ